ncbi:hypothetical protein EXIGLDRAFT_719904, partial [Exidia glandulosa HHB12029]
MSTFFNRRPDRPPSSPKRTPNPRMPLVQLDESLTARDEGPGDDEDIENKDSAIGSDVRILVDSPHAHQHSHAQTRSPLTADELLQETPYATIRRHPLLERSMLGASTASVDSLSLRDLGISLTNSTTLSLLRIPEPPQLSQLRERDTDSMSDRDRQRARHPSLDNSSSINLSFTDVSFDILHDDLRLQQNDDIDLAALPDLDDFTPLPMSDDSGSFPRTSTLAHRAPRPSHAILNEFSMMEANAISPVKPRLSQSPVRNEVVNVDGTPVTSPSRKSKFSFKRWDKSGTPSTTASPAPKSKPSTPRATSPVGTPRSTSFFDKFRGAPQDGKRSKPNTPLATKPTTPVENPSPASTVKGTGDQDDGTEVDEFGVASPSTGKKPPVATRPAPSRTSSSTSSSGGTRFSSSSGPRPSSTRPLSPVRKPTTTLASSRTSTTLSLRGGKAPSASGARSPISTTTSKTSSIGARRVAVEKPPVSSAPASKTTFKAPAPVVSKLAKPPASTATTTNAIPKSSSKLQLPSIRSRTTISSSSAAPATASVSKPPPAPSSRFNTLTKPRTHTARASISIPPSSISTTSAKPAGFGHTRSRSQIPSSSSMGVLPSAGAATSSGMTRSNSLAIGSRVPATSGLKKPGETVAKRPFGMG